MPDGNGVNEVSLVSWRQLYTVLQLRGIGVKDVDVECIPLRPRFFGMFTRALPCLVAVNIPLLFPLKSFRYKMGWDFSRSPPLKCRMGRFGLCFVFPLSTQLVAACHLLTQSLL